MREFKFRAWDNSRCEMINDVSEHHKGLDGILSEDWRYTAMQYTGLKDRNGREIYESDVISHSSGLVPRDSDPRVKQVVTWERYKYVGIGNYSNTAVIGNIYENPELMEGGSE